MIFEIIILSVGIVGLLKGIYEFRKSRTKEAGPERKMLTIGSLFFITGSTGVTVTALICILNSS
jgi:hypothetical protein